MLRALVIVALGVVLGLLIVWMVMSQVPDRQPANEQFRMPNMGPAGR